MAKVSRNCGVKMHGSSVSTSLDEISEKGSSGKESQGSTKSLSVFLDPRVILLMPRSEELTYNLYGSQCSSSTAQSSVAGTLNRRHSNLVKTNNDLGSDTGASLESLSLESNSAGVKSEGVAAVKDEKEENVNVKLKDLPKQGTFVLRTPQPSTNTRDFNSTAMQSASDLSGNSAIARTDINNGLKNNENLSTNINKPSDQTSLSTLQHKGNDSADATDFSGKKERRDFSEQIGRTQSYKATAQAIMVIPEGTVSKITKRLSNAGQNSVEFMQTNKSLNAAEISSKQVVKLDSNMTDGGNKTTDDKSSVKQQKLIQSETEVDSETSKDRYNNEAINNNVATNNAKNKDEKVFNLENLNTPSEDSKSTSEELKLHNQVDKKTESENTTEADSKAVMKTTTETENSVGQSLTINNEMNLSMKSNARSNGPNPDLSSTGYNTNMTDNKRSQQKIAKKSNYNSSIQPSIKPNDYASIYDASASKESSEDADTTNDMDDAALLDKKQLRRNELPLTVDVIPTYLTTTSSETTPSDRFRNERNIWNVEPMRRDDSYSTISDTNSGMNVPKTNAYIGSAGFRRQWSEGPKSDTNNFKKNSSVSFDRSYSSPGPTRDRYLPTSGYRNYSNGDNLYDRNGYLTRNGEFDRNSAAKNGPYYQNKSNSKAERLSYSPIPADKSYQLDKRIQFDQKNSRPRGLNLNHAQRYALRNEKQRDETDFDSSNAKNRDLFSDSEALQNSKVTRTGIKPLNSEEKYRSYSVLDEPYERIKTNNYYYRRTISKESNISPERKQAVEGVITVNSVRGTLKSTSDFDDISSVAGILSTSTHRQTDEYRPPSAVIGKITITNKRSPSPTKIVGNNKGYVTSISKISTQFSENGRRELNSRSTTPQTYYDISGIAPVLEDARRFDKDYRIRVNVKPSIMIRSESRAMSENDAAMIHKRSDSTALEYYSCVSDQEEMFSEYTNAVDGRKVTGFERFPPPKFQVTETFNSRPKTPTVKNNIGFNLELIDLSSSKTTKMSGKNDRMVSIENMTRRNVIKNGVNHRNLSREQSTNEQWINDGLDFKNDSALPNIVRGKCLIKNSMDTIKPNKISEPSHNKANRISRRVSYESNTNIFDEDYLQSKENPLYLSDHEINDRLIRKRLTRKHPETSQPSSVQYTTPRKKRFDSQLEKLPISATKSEFSGKSKKDKTTDKEKYSNRKNYTKDPHGDWQKDSAFEKPGKNGEKFPNLSEDNVFNDDRNEQNYNKCNKNGESNVYAKLIEAKPEIDEYDENGYTNSRTGLNSKVDVSSVRKMSVNNYNTKQQSAASEKRFRQTDSYDDYDREYSRRSDAPKKSWKSSFSKYPSQQRNRGSGFDDDEEFSREITVNRDFDSVVGRRRYSTENGDSRERRRSFSSSIIKREPEHPVITDLTKIDIRSLFIGAPLRSVTQTIDVERLEDELLYSLPPGRYPKWSRPRRLSSTGDNGTNSPLDEFDQVDDSVALDVRDGKAFLTCKARSEKIVPILGTEEMFKKSAMLVTRRIEVDLMATPTRRSLYELILEKQREGGAFDTFSNWRYSRQESGGELPGLTQRENAELYRTFMGLAELYKMV